MADKTGIEWTDHTFNGWIGCEAIGPGCDNCYAKKLVERFGDDFAARRLTSDENWRKPIRWNLAAAKAGQRARVFTSSLADVFDNAVPQTWRDRLFALIRETPNLDWQVLTKRIGNVSKMLPADWGNGYPNVWLGITVVNQQEADRDIPKLLAVPARIRWLSMEPLVGPVDLSSTGALPSDSDGDAYEYSAASWPSDGPSMPPYEAPPHIDWVVVGGESGAEARPMLPEWAQSLRDQCEASDVPFLFKQWGEWVPGESINWMEAPERLGRRPHAYWWVDSWHFGETNMDDPEDNWMDDIDLYRVGKRNATRLLDGVLHDGYPEVQP